MDLQMISQNESPSDKEELWKEEGEVNESSSMVKFLTTIQFFFDWI